MCVCVCDECVCTCTLIHKIGRKSNKNNFYTFPNIDLSKLTIQSALIAEKFLQRWSYSWEKYTMVISKLYW